MSEQDNLPLWRGQRGRSEVWFLTISDPERRRGYWIRYTVRAPVSGPPEPRVWFAAFSLDNLSSPVALNEAVPHDELRLGDEIRMGGSTFGSGAAAGTVAAGGHRAGWELTFDTGGPTLALLPGPVQRMAPTKPLAPNPDTRFSGTIELDGERWELASVPGQQGHLYGTRHAERWAWTACNAFQDDEAVFQALSAQGRRGPFLTPFLCVAALRWGGEWIRFRRVSPRRSWGLGWWRMSFAGRHHRLEADVRAPVDAMVRARYLDPDDTPRWCHNSEVGSCRLTLWERRAGGWQDVAELTSDGTTHAEWAGRTPAVAVTTLHQEGP